MFYLIGTDEAGYGPNFGPLAVSATLWRVENDALSPDTLYEVLAPEIVRTGTGRKKKDGEIFIPIADSKKIHRHETLAPLETAIFAAISALGKISSPVNSDDLCGILCGEKYRNQRGKIPWHTPETKLILPKDLAWEKVLELTSALTECMKRSRVTLCGIHSNLVFPERFNAGIEECGSKGVLLSDTTMKLIVHCWNQVREMEEKRLHSVSPVSAALSASSASSVNSFSDACASFENKELPEVRVFCDKLGGRNFYLPILMEFFPNLPFCVVQEGREFSEYVHYGEYAALRIRFQAKGENILPVALASMVSKYLREISMERFNIWWRFLLPEIRPTAGYPLDAKRFREEITPKMEELKLNWSQFWRNR